MRSRTALSAARVVPKAAATTESAVGETHVATRRRPGQTTRLRRDCEAGDGSGLEPDGAVPGHRHLHDAIAPAHEIERPREARAASVTPSAPSPPRSRSTRADHSEHGDDLLLTAAGRGDVDLSSRMTAPVRRQGGGHHRCIATETTGSHSTWPSEGGDLAERGGRPHVGVVDKLGGAVGSERRQQIGLRLACGHLARSCRSGSWLIVWRSRTR